MLTLTMKKYFAGAVLAAVAVMPVFARAATFVAREEYSSRPQDVLTGSLYVASNSVSVGGAVTGDLLAVGGSVVITGAVGGDVLAGSGNIQLLAPVQGDVRVVAGQFSVNSRIGGDLVVLGGSASVLPGAVVVGSVYVLGGQVTIDGSVSGSVVMKGGRLAVNGSVFGDVTARVDESVAIGPDANIAGTLSYRSPKEAVIGSGARVGAIDYIPRLAREAAGKAGKGVILAIASALTAMKLLMMLGFAALIVWRWRRNALEVLQDAHDRFWGSAGRGLAYGILVPIGAILLVVSLVGTFVGAAAFLVYGLMVMVAGVLAGMFLGVWLQKTIKKNAILHLEWFPALGGVVLLELVGIVPLAGPLLQFLLCLVAFGALAHRVHRALA